jgi:hypothetical protein
MQRRHFIISSACASFPLMVPVSLAVTALPKPSGSVILRVKGEISVSNAAGAAEFDRAMLQKLPGRKAQVKTPWEEGVVDFEGPRLDAVLEAAGASGSRIIVRALNDYSVEIPMSDAIEFPTILAMTRNGASMSIRDKGPLFLIYPFDLKPELYTETYFSRSVWQISEIEVLR